MIISFNNLLIHNLKTNIFQNFVLQYFCCFEIGETFEKSKSKNSIYDVTTCKKCFMLDLIDFNQRQIIKPIIYNLKKLIMQKKNSFFKNKNNNKTKVEIMTVNWTWVVWFW